MASSSGGFYGLFGLEERLSLDLADLEKRFHDLSRKLHPDRQGRKPAREQEQAVAAAALLNDGYRTLRDPIRRAEYVLKLRGLDVGGQRSKDVPPELLEEVFELNMALEELRAGDGSVRPQLEQARQRFFDMLAGVDQQLNDQFARYDETRDETVMAAIRAALNRRRYIRNLVKEVEKELAGSAFSN